MHRLLRSTLLGLALYSASTGAQTDGQWVPEGFESLLEKQTTLVDVYYGGELVTSLLASYNANEIVLGRPEVIVNNLPNVTDIPTVLDALSQPLPVNAGAICHSTLDTECGSLLPDIAAVIFDETTFRVDLFLGSEYVSQAIVGKGGYLPPSDAEFGYLSQVSGAFAGTSNDLVNATSINVANSISYQENRFVLNANYNDVQELSIDEMLLRRDFRGREYTGGYFRTTNDAFMRFIPEDQMRGIRLASTIDTRTDLETSTGRQMTVFLATRARVGIFRDGRLLSSRIYDAGNQVLETSSLPSGVYPVTLLIEEVGGGVREETRFYMKSNRFPPRGQPIYGLELGEQVTRFTEGAMPEALGNLLGRASLSTRIADSTAFNGGVSVRGDRWVTEAGIDYLGAGYDFQLNGAVSDNDGYGLALTSRYDTPFTTLTASYRQTWVDGDFEAGSLPTGNTGIDDADETAALLSIISEREFFLSDTLQVDISAITPIGNGSFNVVARYLEGPDLNPVKELSFRMTQPLWRGGKYDLRLDTEVNWINGSWQGLLTLNLRRDSLPYTQNYEYTARHQDVDGRGTRFVNEGSVSALYNAVTDRGSDYALAARANSRADFDSIGADAQYRGVMGRGDLQVEQTMPTEGEEVLAINGNFGTSIGGDTKGVGIGGGDQSLSGIVVKLSGGDPRTWFDVIVNGSRRASARGGRSTIVTLPPFQTHIITLQPRGGDLVSFETRPRTLTLYPGNMETLVWDVSPVRVVFGRMLDTERNPIRNAVIQGAEGLAMTDDYGFFQAEVKAAVDQLSIQRGDTRCQVAIEKSLVQIDDKEDVLSVGPLTCSFK